MTDATDLGALLAEGFRTVPRESVVTSVARRLLEQLTTGKVAPGTRLPSERQLATSLDVGRSAVREALAALDILGIVDIRPGSGTYLSASSSDILPRTINWGLMLGQPRTHDLVEVRAQLEVLSAELAAQRATDEEIEALRACVEAMRAGVLGDVKDFVQSDVDFHLEVARAAHNSVLNDVLHSIRELLYVWVSRTSQDRPSAEASLAEHAAVFDAIVARDVAAARAAMTSHMATASARLQRSLDQSADAASS